MGELYLDANGLEGCPRCYRNLAPDGQGGKICTCPDRDKNLRLAVQHRAERRQLSLPGTQAQRGPPSNWWRDYGK